MVSENSKDLPKGEGAADSQWRHDMVFYMRANHLTSLTELTPTQKKLILKHRLPSTPNDTVASSAWRGRQAVSLMCNRNCMLMYALL